MTVPTPAGGAPPPIEIPPGNGAIADRLSGTHVPVDDHLLARLSAECALVDVATDSLKDAGRDWWPISLRWALEGMVPSHPAAVARPSSVGEVSAVLRICNDAGVPVTATGGRSGVCGAAVPVFGGVSLDCRGLTGILGVDEESLLVDVASGTFGPALEAELSVGHGLTIGHWPQSMEIATVGGWLACRGAGQYSTRYGKIEEIVAGLEVVLADGTVVRTGAMAASGAGPRAAMGPDLTQVFVGSEGTLGVITSARLKAHPVAEFESRLAFGFDRFEEGLDCLRRTLRRGATPAVVRLYDATESRRSFGHEEGCVLVALDEGDEAVVTAAMGVLGEECSGASRLDGGLVERWLDHRNDVSALESVTRAGIVVDTIEVAAPWRELGPLYADALGLVGEVDGLLAASAHESHAYLDGACLYFTFAGRGKDPGDGAWAERFYRDCWSAVLRATSAHGGSISHHHGIGLVRSPYIRDALGNGFRVLQAVKDALDPKGIMNPGKLGLSGPFGASPWPGP